jgi:HD-like signal output (HDOD) protein
MREGQRGGVDIVAAVEALPPLPAVALRVMQVAQDTKASAADLAVVVSADPGLSSRVLRVVNSAAYRRMREITSVQQALVTLGFVQARNLAISGAVAGAFAPDALHALFRIETFWRHSIAVAFRAAELAGEGRRVDVPTAFTAGIVHNMGRLALFYRDPALVDQAVARAMAEGRVLEEVEGELGFDHAAAGELLARRWQLPEPICEAIGKHHEPFETNQTLVGCVAMADRYVVANGLLPGYVLPPAPGTHPAQPPEFVHLVKQVDALMELVGGNRVGVRAA